MPITTIHSYLVHPAKNVADQPVIGGATVELRGQLFDMLSKVYEDSDTECNIEVAFNHATDGQQQNPCRDLLVAHVGTHNLTSGRRLAERLQSVTTNRSGLGLLFLLLGREGNHHKLVVSRFPADNGILAEEGQDGLTVEFIEQIFMKSATAYKAAVYSDASLATGFWDGNCVDKQINNVATVSDYWIKAFLASDFKTTSAQGTRTLAVALRQAIASTNNLAVKEELVSAVRMSAGLNGTTISALSVAERFALSDAARSVFERQLNPSTLAQRFRFSRAEFGKHISYSSVELDNGAILSAEATRFDEVFEQQQHGENVRYSTEGRVVDQKVRKTKA